MLIIEGGARLNVHHHCHIWQMNGIFQRTDTWKTYFFRKNIHLEILQSRKIRELYKKHITPTSNVWTQDFLHKNWNICARITSTFCLLGWRLAELYWNQLTFCSQKDHDGRPYFLFRYSYTSFRGGLNTVGKSSADTPDGDGKCSV